MNRLWIGYGEATPLGAWVNASIVGALSGNILQVCVKMWTWSVIAEPEKSSVGHVDTRRIVLNTRVNAVHMQTD